MRDYLPLLVMLAVFPFAFFASRLKESWWGVAIMASFAAYFLMQAVIWMPLFHLMFALIALAMCLKTVHRLRGA